MDKLDRLQAERDLCKSRGHIPSSDKFRVGGGKVWICCERCGKPIERRALRDCSETVLQSALGIPEIDQQIPQLLWEHLGRYPMDDFSVDYAKVLLEHLDEERLHCLVRSDKLKEREQHALVRIADDAMLDKLCCEDAISAVAQEQRHFRQQRHRQQMQAICCPDGTPHAFGNEQTEWVDMGPKGDDDMAAHDYWERKYWICQKCGYRKKEWG